MTTESFPLVLKDGADVSMPLVPIMLRSRYGADVTAQALLDTGATVNLLPYDLGVKLGLTWEAEERSLTISGAFSGLEARGIVLHGKVGGFKSVPLVFAWCKSEVPLILGNLNFFDRFDFCLVRSEGRFELKLV